MAIKYNGTTIQTIKYGSTNLDKVYYKNGSANPVLVFATPIVYNGGDGKQLFSSKSFVFTYWNSSPRYRDQKQSTGWSTDIFTFGTSSANSSILFELGGSSEDDAFVGAGYLVANKTFNISLFTTMTVVLNHNTSNSGVTAYIGLQTQCEKSGALNTDSYGLSGTHYQSSAVNMQSNSDFTITLNLSTAKSKGSDYYPYIYLQRYKVKYTPVSSVRVKSIIFS